MLPSCGDLQYRSPEARDRTGNRLAQTAYSVQNSHQPWLDIRRQPNRAGGGGHTLLVRVLTGCWDHSALAMCNCRSCLEV